MDITWASSTMAELTPVFPTEAFLDSFAPSPISSDEEEEKDALHGAAPVVGVQEPAAVGEAIDVEAEHQPKKSKKERTGLTAMKAEGWFTVKSCLQELCLEKVKTPGTDNNCLAYSALLLTGKLSSTGRKKCACPVSLLAPYSLFRVMCGLQC